MSNLDEALPITRRRFLIGAAAAALPAIIPASVLGAGPAPAPSNRITMGFIGLGSQGTSNMRAFLTHKQAQVVALCDLDRDNLENARSLVNAANKNNSCKVYHDYRELLADSSIDAIAIAVPDHWHALVAIAAARAGKDVYGEKPLARSIREARAIVRAVERYGIVWQTGSWQRSRAEFYRAAMLVRNGRIGKINSIEVGLPTGTQFARAVTAPCPENLDWNFWLGPAPYSPYQPLGSDPSRRCHWNWRWIMDYSGGQLTDWAGHHIDIAHWAMGLENTGPVSVAGKGEYPTDGIYNAPMGYDFNATYKSGLTIRVANDKKVKMGVRFHGENGQWIYCTRGKMDANPRKLIQEFIGPEEIHLMRSVDHFQNFLDAVRLRGRTIAPVEEAARSIGVGLLGEIAMLTGRPIRWDPDKEEILGDPEAARLLGRAYREPWAGELSRIV